jgi:acid stress chaperone HdeB
LVLRASQAGLKLAAARCAQHLGNTNMKILAMALLAGAVFVAVPAKAEKFDLSTVTCKQFFEYNKENLSLLLVWLEGYYADQDADPVIDFDDMAEKSKKLGAYCAENPTIGLITAAEKIYGQ